MTQIDYTEWADTLNKYKAEMEKELAAVRAAKQELVEMQRELQEKVMCGRYERDEDTLILSAPNIIIGNVDKFGNLMAGASNIVIRGNNVALEGVGYTTGTSVSGGSVTTRARNVSIQTVDPGIDGMEAVAFPDSSFTVQTSSIGMSAETVESSANGGVYTLAAQPVMGCINFTAETNINLAAAGAIEDKNLTTVAKDLETESKGYAKKVDSAIKGVDANTKALDKNQNNMLLDMIGAASEEADTMALRMGEYQFEDRSMTSEILTVSIAQGVHSSTVGMSLMAENARVAKCLNERAKHLKENSQKFQKEPNGSSVTINSETIGLSTIGADGKIRTTPGNGIKFTSQNFAFSTLEALKPIPNSSFRVVANDISMDASDYTFEEKDKTMALSKSEAKGSFRLNAGSIEITGQDRTFDKKGDTVEVKPVITAGSEMHVNIGAVHFDLADAEGKAQGSFITNAKDVMLNSYDVDKEDRIKPTAVTEGGKVTLGAKEVYVGTVVKDMIAETVQVAGKNVNVLGDEKVDLQQAKDKSHLLLDDNAELSGKEVKLVGNITLGGKIEAKDKITALDIDAKNVKAGSSISGPNFKDGIPVPAPGSPVQPGKGAELKNVEPPKGKEKKK